MSGAGGEPLAHHVSTTGAEGRIGRITLNDIAVTNTSGLIDAPRHITVAGTRSPHSMLPSSSLMQASRLST